MLKSFLRFLLILVISIVIADTSSHGRYRLRTMEKFEIASRTANVQQQQQQQKKCDYDICEDIEDYPDDLMDQLAEKHTSLKSFFGKVIEPHKPILELRGSFDDLMNLCETKIYTVKPKFIKDIYGNYRYIVNTEENQQLIVYETCARKLHKCFDGPINTEAYCEQKFSVIKLVALENNETLTYGRFRIPQTCVCAYRGSCLTGDC